MWKTNLTVALTLSTMRQTNAVCNVCNSNGAACVSNNTFNLCFRGIPDTTITYNCRNADEVCTVLGQICMAAHSNRNIQAACGNTKQCGQCVGVGNGAYTCTSRTTFTMCMGSALSNVRGTCRIGEVCRTSVALSGRTPCVNECLMDPLDMCDVNLAVDAPPTTASVDTTVIIRPTPPPAPTTQSTAVSCSNRTQMGRYPNPADNGCTSYLYCSSSTSGLVGHLRRCPAGKFFNPLIRNCQNAKPSGCT